jgi:hypothetical protein
MKIYVKKNRTPHGLCWAWEESMKVKIWGIANTLEEIKIRASKKFAIDKESIELCFV